MPSRADGLVDGGPCAQVDTLLVTSSDWVTWVTGPGGGTQHLLLAALGAGIAGITASGSPRASVGRVHDVCALDSWGETRSATCSVGTDLEICLSSSSSPSSSCTFEQVRDVTTLLCPYL